MQSLFQMIPKVDEILAEDYISALIEKYSRSLVVDAIRQVLDGLREDIKASCSEEELKNKVANIESLIAKELSKLDRHSLRKVINATGVVLHTNLGRAPINQEVLDDIRDVAAGYSNLEYDIEKGARGQRYSHLDSIITKITGAEAAMVVNNNASAVMLILSTFAKGKEVITSRGELIEIGGAFRVPDVMAESGAKMIEVGTTNKTHLWDYERAITEETAAIFKVHTSNYRVLGFTESVSASELMDLKEKNNILILEDLGSGVLVDLSKYGLQYEPTVQDSLKNGVDLVSFSGDKLLGGPQAGIIVGKKELIEKMKKNPLTRALRVDKFVISALESILRYYLDEEIAVKKIPTLRMLTYTLEELKEKAQLLYDRLQGLKIPNLDLELVRVDSEVGGGSLPLELLPSYAVALRSDKYSADRLETLLRANEIPIVVRIIKDKVILDVRTIDESENSIIEQAIKGLE